MPAITSPVLTPKIPLAELDCARGPRGSAERRRPLLFRGRLSLIRGLEVELAVALGEEQALRGLVAGRRVPIVPARLQQVRTGTQPDFGLSFGPMDERARHDHGLHGIRVRVQRSRKSRWTLDQRAVRACRMVAPKIRNLESRSAGGVEVGPLDVASRPYDRPARLAFRT